MRLVRNLNRKPWTWLLILAAALAFHFAAEKWWKAALIMLGAILLDIVVDLAFTKVEEEAGEIEPGEAEK